MPICRKCGVMQATAEMNRGKQSQAGTWLCKDHAACKQRRIARRANEIALKKGQK